MNRRALFLSFSFILSGAAGAQPDRLVIDTYREQIAAGRALILNRMLVMNTPGVSVAVAVDGEPVWSEGMGLAQVELGVPVSRGTKFRIGSVSKALTAGGLVRLVQEGKIDLDAPIQRYVPSFPSKKYSLTTRHVAGHLGGIRHYRGVEFLSQKRYNTVTEGLSIFQDDSLLFEPGSRYSYSSYGFNLVSAVMEGASGIPFLQYMSTYIFDRFGMSNTVPEYPDSLIVGRAGFYTVDSASITNAPAVDNSYKWAGGGFLSTADDLLSYGLATLSDSAFSTESRRLLFTSQRTSSGKDVEYSVGWQIWKDKQGRSIISHGGRSVGGGAQLVLYPDKNGVIAILSNDDSRTVTVVGELLDLFFPVK